MSENHSLLRTAQGQYQQGHEDKKSQWLELPVVIMTFDGCMPLRFLLPPPGLGKIKTTHFSGSSEESASDFLLPEGQLMVAFSRYCCPSYIVTNVQLLHDRRSLATSFPHAGRAKPWFVQLSGPTNSTRLIVDACLQHARNGFVLLSGATISTKLCVDACLHRATNGAYQEV